MGAASAAILGLLAACSPPEAPADEKVLRVYNWSDYIGQDTLARFEAETGIRVTYDVFDSNEVLEAKLLSGASGYDVVVPSAEFMARQIPAGVFQPLDHARLSGYGNLDPALLDLVREADPANTYGVPYLWGTTGIGYNLDQVRRILGPDAPVTSLDLLFRPENLRRLSACGVAFVDAPREVFSAALTWLGLDPGTTDPDLYRHRARPLLDRIRPFITYFHSSRYINDLANGEICVAFGWSGDILQAGGRAREADQGVRVAYAIPDEGALVWFDMLAIPAGASHVDNAHRFIDFLLRPDVIATVTGQVRYANANRAADALIPAALRTDPGIYPAPPVRARLYSLGAVPPPVDRVISRLWTDLRTGR